MKLPRDLKEFIGLLNSEKVEYAIVGGWAFGFYAHPRYTEDLDILIRATPSNAVRVESAIKRFGFGSLGLTAADFLSSDQVVQLGHAPHRIDLLTSLTGVGSEEIWADLQAGEIDGMPVFFLGRTALVRNKKATGRPRDRADIEELGADH